MSLEELNLVELTKEEKQEIDGGIIAAMLALGGAAFYFGWQLGREYAQS